MYNLNPITENALPDPCLLRLQAVLVGVLHASGAAGVFGELQREWFYGKHIVPAATGDDFVSSIVNWPTWEELYNSVSHLQNLSLRARID